MENELTAETKALLLAIGSADIDPALLPPLMKTTATAGPGAGGSSCFIRSGPHRIRLSINRNSPFRIAAWGGGVLITRRGEIIAGGILELPPCHCPEQAYITVSERCVFDCRFCPVPKLNGRVKTIDEIVSLVDAARKHGRVRAISLTSGVADTPEKEAAYMVHVVQELAERYDLPIGVSIYPTTTSTEDLHAAGACEIKYNVETMDREIFRKVCPGLSLDTILTALEGAVVTFGKNHVSSNFIIGLGETDECVTNGVETLAAMGVIPNLRPISPHPLRAGEIFVERPSASRLLLLARINQAALERYGLDARQAKTMCLPCTGCDLTPQRDV